MSDCSRRSFLKSLGAAAAVSASKMRAFYGALAETPGSFLISNVFPNCAPLAKNVFYPFSLGAIRPKGWLLEQLRIQAQGLGGHLDEFWPDLSSDSGWLGGPGESWERGPYFLDGLVPLAHLLQDHTLLAKTNKWIDWTLKNQAATGMIGPSKNDDWWPRMVMLKVLTQHHEATGDPRVIPAMRRYFAYQLEELTDRPLRDWGKYRWQDELLSIVWLYNRTADSDLLQLAQLLRQQGYGWKSQFDSFQYTKRTSAKELGLQEGKPLPEIAMQTHGVNNAMALKTSALWWLFSKDSSERGGVERQLTMLDLYHGMPTGMFSADEHYAGKNPSQGVELCAVVENMFSLECAVAVLGTPALGDRLERIAFNALPGAFTDDMWAHQYDQQPNQIECTLGQRPWTTNGPESNLFGLEPNFGCCTANMHQGWPKFTSHLWMAASNGAIAAIAYAPSELRSQVAGVPVLIEEETMYPFEEEIRLRFRPAQPVRFPVALRIPGWAKRPTAYLNGKAIKNVHAGEFTMVTREWKPGDRLQLTFPMKVRTERSYNNSLVVCRGPILFSLDVEPEWKKLRTRGMSADWELRPASAWNYGLLTKGGKFLGQAEKMHPANSEDSIFSRKGAPITLELRGARISEWETTDGVAGELPQSPVTVAGPEEELALVPYAAAKLRITAFPEIARSKKTVEEF